MFRYVRVLFSAMYSFLVGSIITSGCVLPHSLQVGALPYPRVDTSMGIVTCNNSKPVVEVMVAVGPHSEVRANLTLFLSTDLGMSVPRTL
jgi:hypothetical protein